MSAVLTFTILGGAAVRLIGINWGLPLMLHPDEGVIVGGALNMAQRHSFEPANYFRPDHVEIELSNLAYLAYSWIFHGKAPVALYLLQPAPFVLISRLITACFGIGMIVLAYRIGVRFNRLIGIITAFLVAFFPPFVVHSHFATPDVPLALAFMVVILGCMRYLDAPLWRNLLLACLGVSVAIAIKYPGAVGAVTIGVTVLVSGIGARAWRRTIAHAFGSLAAVIGFLFLISPVLFTNAATVLSNFSDEAGGNHAGVVSLGWLDNMRFYASGFATSAGIVLVVSFALGTFWSVRLRLRQSLPLWAGAAVWPALSAVGLHWDRWALPMYLSPLLIAPIGIYYSARYLLAKDLARWVRWAAVAVGTLTAVNLFIGSAAVAAQYAARNVENVGAGALAARQVNGTNTVFEGYTSLRPGLPKGIFDQFDVIDGRLMLGAKVKDRAKMRYVLISSETYDRYYAAPKFALERNFYRMLGQQYPLITTYRPVPPPTGSLFEVAGIWRSVGYLAGIAGGGLSGPTLQLYEIPADHR